MTVISDVLLIIFNAFNTVIAELFLSLIYMIVIVIVILLSIYLMQLIRKDIRQRLRNNNDFIAFIKKL